MKITVTTSYEISYAIRTFSDEGRADTYQDGIETLELALGILDQVRSTRKMEEWRVVVDVEKFVNGKKVDDTGGRFIKKI